MTLDEALGNPLLDRHRVARSGCSARRLRRRLEKLQARPHVDWGSGEGFTMLIFLLACLLILAAFPASPLGRLLRRYLVDLPARRLNTIRAGHVAMLIGLALIGLIMFHLFDAEGLRVFGMMAPEIGVWFSTFELSLVIDALVIGAAIATMTRLRDMGLLVRRAVDRLIAGMARVFGARQPRTPSRPRRPEGSTSDDPDPWRWTPVLA